MISKKYEGIDDKDVKKILEVFFSKGTASQIEINDKVIELVWEMLASSKECTKAIHFVPRPQGLAASAMYVAKELAKIAYRVSADKDDSVYQVCKVFSARGYATKIKLAGMGL